MSFLKVGVVSSLCTIGLGFYIMKYQSGPIGTGVIKSDNYQNDSFIPQDVGMATEEKKLDFIKPVERSKPSFYDQEIACMQKNLYFEARNQGAEGMRAVAMVTLNRVKSKIFPKTVCGVVYQAKTSAGKVLLNQCQFSWYCNGKKMRVDFSKKEEASAWRLAGQIAKVALQGKLNDPRLEKAKFYHTEDMETYPQWASEANKIAHIGKHIFYEAAK